MCYDLHMYKMLHVQAVREGAKYLLEATAS